ncbi:MAG: hypothetical protein ABSE22_15090 [Xanthobacteraceae bacterium]|jgi:hypothetical protein
MRNGRRGATLNAGFIARLAAGLVAGLALTAASPLAAQQNQTPSQQPSIMDEPDQAPPPKPAPHRHSKAASQTQQPDPDLDTDDQLAPSQIKQPMPAAVAEPGGAAPRKPAPAAMHAAASPAPPPAATAAPPAAAAPVTRPATARAPSPGAQVIACVGAFSKDSSHLRLAMTFDSKNITFTDVDSSAGTKVPASVLYPNDPKRRLEVWWADPAGRRQTYLIVINGHSTWVGPGGLRLGLTLEQLEKLNHKPFKLKGFDKDGVATISDWDGGALATLPGDCKSGVSLHADPKASADAIGAAPAAQEFSSSDADIRAAKPTVSEVLIGY